MPEEQNELFIAAKQLLRAIEYESEYMQGAAVQQLKTIVKKLEQQRAKDKNFLKLVQS